MSLLKFTAAVLARLANATNGRVQVIKKLKRQLGIDRDSYAAAVEYCKSKPEHTFEQTIAAMAAFGFGVGWNASKNAKKVDQLKLLTQKRASEIERPKFENDSFKGCKFAWEQTMRREKDLKGEMEQVKHLWRRDSERIKELELLAESYSLKLAKLEAALKEIAAESPLGIDDGFTSRSRMYTAREALEGK